MTAPLPVVWRSEDGGLVVRQGFLDGPPKRYRFRVNYPVEATSKMAQILGALQTVYLPDACWPWPYSKNGGYGELTVWKMHRGRKRSRNFRAHRVAWVVAGNTFPNGDLTIDHMCHNPECVNPAHLRLLTLRENALDAWHLQLAQQAQTS